MFNYQILKDSSRINKDNFQLTIIERSFETQQSELLTNLQSKGSLRTNRKDFQLAGEDGFFRILNFTK